MINWPIDTVDNKYKKWYEALVIKAKNRSLSEDIYTEHHHIIPRSLGGDDSKSNLVVLTAREHFVGHWLLPKFTLGTAQSKMFWALNCMKRNSVTQVRYDTPITSRVYEKIRPIISQQQTQRMTGRVPTQSHREKMRAAMKGKPKSLEHVQKMREARLGKPGHKWTEEQKIKYQNRIKELGGPMLGKSHTQEARMKMSIGQKARITPEERIQRSIRSSGENNPMYGRKHTEEAKKKMSRLGMKHSEETKAKMRLARSKQPGRPMSEETKKKISEAHIRRNQNKAKNDKLS